MDELMDLYFEGMIRGYCTGELAKHETGLFPGMTFIQLEKGNLMFLDYYMKGVSEVTGITFGMTFIFANGKPVWRMDYEGFYPKETTPFLKKALLESYTDKEWTGGRGPTQYHSRGFIYSNIYDSHNDIFVKFQGEEKIVDAATYIDLGYHKYRGGMI